ncbi:hypothetical protein BDR05DRAFT_963190 [Suillus weaverae]|nr:hypothetical protein BDR05DRAFT_963190 [Suillus weaverae]
MSVSTLDQARAPPPNLHQPSISHQISLISTIGVITQLIVHTRTQPKRILLTRYWYVRCMLLNSDCECTAHETQVRIADA